MRLPAVATLVALLATVARADPPGLTPPVAPVAPEADVYTDSYRSQVLGADGLAVGLVMVAALTSRSGRSNTSLAEISLATYLLGGPLVHLLHDRPGHAAASLGLRVGLPVIFAFAGVALTSSNCSTCDDDGAAGAAGAVLGGLLGGVAAVVIDSVLLARGDDRPDPDRAHLTATPLRGGGVVFGVARTF